MVNPDLLAALLAARVRPPHVSAPPGRWRDYQTFYPWQRNAFYNLPSTPIPFLQALLAHLNYPAPPPRTLPPPTPPPRIV